MQHKTLEDLQRVAAVFPDQTRPAMTRSQRLERWAELLEREPNRRLNALTGTEYQPSDTRATMRSSDSPLSVAFDDPVLRRAVGSAVAQYRLLLPSRYDHDRRHSSPSRSGRHRWVGKFRAVSLVRGSIRPLVRTMLQDSSPQFAEMAN
jgi:hypothetical protein